MRMRALPPELEELLLKSHFAYICTVDTNNRPHVTPIFYVFEKCPPFIYFLTSSRTKKIANIESNPRVSLTIDRRDPVDPQNNLGVFIRGRSELLGELSSADQRVEWEQILFESFERKYRIFGDWLLMQEAEFKTGSLVWVKIKPYSMTWWMHWTFKTIIFR